MLTVQTGPRLRRHRPHRSTSWRPVASPSLQQLLVEISSSIDGWASRELHVLGFPLNTAVTIERKSVCQVEQRCCDSWPAADSRSLLVECPVTAVARAGSALIDEQGLMRMLVIL